MKWREVIVMKNIKLFLLSVISIIAAASMAFATGGEKTGPVPSSLPVAANVQQIAGEVKAVNTVTKSVTVAKKLGKKVIEATVAVDNKTKITEENENKSLADMKAGNMAVVKYTKIGNKNVAKSIDFKPATGTEAKKP
jgi:hypothetical protein